MISGIVLLTALLFAAVPSPTSTASPDAAALIAHLRQPVPADAVFTEVRFVHMLQRPLRLSGELHYGGAGQLGKRIDRPYRENTTIAEGEVKVEREGKAAKNFSLQRAPELEALLAGFTALLDGDAQTLDRYYSIGLDARVSNWRLTLTPRDPAFSRQLSEIVIDGADTQIRCFTLHEADGDSSAMLLGGVASEKFPEPPTPAALDILCRGAAR